MTSLGSAAFVDACRTAGPRLTAFVYFGRLGIMNMLRAAPSFRRLMFGFLLCCLVPSLWFWSLNSALGPCQRERVLGNRGPRYRNGSYSEAVPPTLPQLSFPAAVGRSVFRQPFSRNGLSISKFLVFLSHAQPFVHGWKVRLTAARIFQSYTSDSGRTSLEVGGRSYIHTGLYQYTHM